MKNTVPYIELHGKSRAVLHRDVNNMKMLFRDAAIGDVVLTIPSTCILYHTSKLHAYYNMGVELKGISTINNGKRSTFNQLIVRKVINS